MTPDSHKRIETYREFWPFYLSEHSLRATKLWHLTGTSLGLLLSIYLMVRGKWLWLPITALPGYAFAWTSHFFVQKNRPATFTYPLWSLISDYRLAYRVICGKS